MNTLKEKNNLFRFSMGEFIFFCRAYSPLLILVGLLNFGHFVFYVAFPIGVLSLFDSYKELHRYTNSHMSARKFKCYRVFSVPAQTYFYYMAPYLLLFTDYLSNWNIFLTGIFVASLFAYYILYINIPMAQFNPTFLFFGSKISLVEMYDGNITVKGVNEGSLLSGGLHYLYSQHFPKNNESFSVVHYSFQELISRVN